MEPIIPMNASPVPITIIDRPCGSGKTTELLNSLDPEKQYLIVVPLLSECERVIVETTKLYGNDFFRQPSTRETETKHDVLRTLIIEGQNIVTTHSLYYKLAEICRYGLLSDYHIIIDEVLEPAVAQPKPKAGSWSDIYIGSGYVTVCPETRLVMVTDKWREAYYFTDDKLCKRLFARASSGCLYEDGSNFLICTIPDILLRSGASLTMYTYKSSGSLLLKFMQWLGLKAEVKTSPEYEEDMKKRARELVTVKLIPSLKEIKFSYNAQSTYTVGDVNSKRVNKALRTLMRNELAGLGQCKLLLTCAKDNWYKNGKGPKDIAKPQAGPFASGTKIFSSATWLPNTTRGTNDYIEASHLIYLYDQYPNPSVSRFLSQAYTKAFKDAYALTELIQWAWRSRVRRGEPITLYLASERMVRIFDDWRTS